MSEDLKTLTLQRIKFAMLLPISKELFNDFRMDISAHANFAADMYVERLMNIFWGKWAEPTVIATYPEDWWEAFKDRWFPYWLLKKYPVKRHRVRAQGGLVFPPVPPELQKYGTPIWRSGSDVVDNPHGEQTDEPEH